MSQAGSCSTATNPPIPSLQAFGQVYNQAVQDIFDGQLFLFDSNGPLVNVSHTAGTAQVTIGISGYYLITWLVNANGTGGNITLLQNGVAVAQGSYVTSASATEPTGQAIVAAVAGDIFTLRNDTGLLLTTDASAGYTSLSMTFVKLTPTQGAGTGGATSFPTDAGTANEVAGVLNILGSTGVTTSGAGNTVTISLPGGGQAIETVTGNTGGAVPPDAAGNLNLVTANTTVDFQGNVGGNIQTLQFGISNLVLGDDLSFVTSGVRNVGLGLSALNAITSGTDNTAIGFGALTLCSTGLHNTAIGSLSLDALTTGTDNTALGDDALAGLTLGSSNIAIGRLAGSAYTGGESGNITIGHTGVLGDPGYTRIGTSQTACFIAGIDGVNVGSTAQVVTMASDQLGTATITAGTGITVTPGANSITISSSGADLLAYTSVNSSPYVVLAGDEFLGVDCSVIPITVQLPNAPSTGRVYIIKDSTGSANTNNITVTTVGGAVNIDGATTYVMNTQYASIQVLWDGSTYQVF